MSEAVYTEQHVFDGGPPLRLQRSLGVVKPDQPRVVRRALVAAVIAWVPLVLLGIVDGVSTSFLNDVSAHARFLIAVPAFILAESDCIPRLERIVRHFVDVDLITDSDLPRYRAAIASTRNLLNSRYAELVVFAITYGLLFLVTAQMGAEIAPTWHRNAAGHFTLARWWHVLVSLPLLLILFFGWLWRLTLWGRFLLLVARMDLQLLPSHPDGVGGLQFISTSLRGFRLISFGISAVVAGSIADLVIHGTDVFRFKSYVIGVAVFVTILFAGPLMVFVRNLRDTKRRGVFEYGALANRMGHEFERKWLSSREVDADILERPDFSATTDYFGVAANVYQMRDLPFTAKDLIAPILPALLPFLGVTLLTIPFQVVLDTLIKLLF